MKASNLVLGTLGGLTAGFILGVLFGMLAALQIYIYADRKKP